MTKADSIRFADIRNRRFWRWMQLSPLYGGHRGDFHYPHEAFAFQFHKHDKTKRGEHYARPPILLFLPIFLYLRLIPRGTPCTVATAESSVSDPFFVSDAALISMKPGSTGATHQVVSRLRRALRRADRVSVAVMRRMMNGLRGGSLNPRK